MVDERRFWDLLQRLERRTADLRAHAAGDRDRLLADRHRLDAVKYAFIEAIQVAIDLGAHVIASEGLRSPESYQDVFVSLVEGGWVPADQRERLTGMAGFRNLLVHGYADVDDRRVVAALDDLGDLDAYRRALARRVSEGEGDGA